VLSSRSCTPEPSQRSCKVTAVSLPGEQADTSPRRWLADGRLRPVCRRTPAPYSRLTASSLPPSQIRSPPSSARLECARQHQSRTVHAWSGSRTVHAPDQRACRYLEPATGLARSESRSAGQLRGHRSATPHPVEQLCSIHGTSFTLTSTSPRERGGATPTGTVRFRPHRHAAGIVPSRTARLTYATAALDGGSFPSPPLLVMHYASSSSSPRPSSSTEQSVLTVAGSSGAIGGAPFDLFVTDASASGRRPSLR